MTIVKELSEELGIEIIGGNKIGIFVLKVLSNSIAARSGVQKGWKIRKVSELICLPHMVKPKTNVFYSKCNVFSISDVKITPIRAGGKELIRCSLFLFLKNPA